MRQASFAARETDNAILELTVRGLQGYLRNLNSTTDQPMDEIKSC